MSASSSSARSQRWPEETSFRSENSSTHDSDSQRSSVTSLSSSPEALSSRTPLAPPAHRVLPSSNSKGDFCTRWFRRQHITCMDTECHPPERRRPLRRVLYTLSVGDLESDDNTSRESSSESENDMSTDNAPGALDTSLSYPLSVERIGGQAVERAYLRSCPCEGCWTACCHLLQVW